MHDAAPLDRACSRSSLLARHSLEMTGKDVSSLLEAAGMIPAKTRINVTFLGAEDSATRVAAARAVRDSGFVPVSHISARRLASEAMLVDMLRALQADGTADEVLVVGGDPSTPEGPYQDSIDLINSGVLGEHGVRRVSIGGYPEGHPEIDDAVLWSALQTKCALLAEQDLAGDIVTQFSFDVEAVLSWVASVRACGIDLPIRIGVPGPAGIRRLLSYAKRFGVGTSALVAKKYGLSLTNLLGTAGPDRFITELQHTRDTIQHGELRLHFYTFGGMGPTSKWITDFLRPS